MDIKINPSAQDYIRHLLPSNHQVLVNEIVKAGDKIGVFNSDCYRYVAVSAMQRQISQVEFSIRVVVNHHKLDTMTLYEAIITMHWHNGQAPDVLVVLDQGPHLDVKPIVLQDVAA